jgi:hypothetical protein
MSLTICGVGLVVASTYLTPLTAPGWAEWIGIAGGVLAGFLLRPTINSLLRTDSA